MTADVRRFMPYGRQHIDDDDVAAVVDALKSDFLTTGPAIERFESGLSDVTGAAHMVACSSGTAALHLACMAAGLGPDDAVVVPAITFVATANTPRFTGAEIVFADVDSETGLMEADHVSAAIARAERPVRAIFTVHLNGQCANLDALRALADRHGAWLIEDACHALGSRYRGTNVGAGLYGEMVCFSFHPVKTIACGEGGAVGTNDPVLAARMARLRNHGIERNPAAFTQPDEAQSKNGTPAPWYYEMSEPGYNYRMSDLHAALGASQLTKLDRFADVRRTLVTAYRDALAPLAPIVRPVPQGADNDPCWHLMVVLIDFDAAGKDRSEVMDTLRAGGIGSQVHYVPVPSQPYYRQVAGGGTYPGAREYYCRCLSLPLHTGMSETDVASVVAALKRALEI
tara:strand:- start:55828 stop:57027 length:1200 start_codon:yes stop_codon:yes gene_type:complete